ncbi:YjgN family protein [Leptospira idonii]|uniref:DUF898 family protein n=1 Tax=Leptospira idonii TaxID=1193500 RepID=A0A4V3JXL3_9LEPT|nr:DUF898 family protein [Leptospira idonii]TGN17128.1 DUF898 family protein [Leptospira idonii]
MDNKRIQYHATGLNLFLILLKNAFLTVFTFFIYHFWAKTNVQKFVAENVEWAGERFSFHGTGKERFIGFLKALVLVIGAAIILGIINTIVGMIVSQSIVQIVSTILTAALFLTIAPFILVGRTKYLTSRTGYRNLRFGFNGKGLELGKIYLRGGLLSIITLGIYFPWFYIEQETYIKNNIRYGNANFGFQADGKEFFFLCLKGIFLSIVTLGIYGAWFSAEIQNYIWGKTTFQGKKFSSDITGGQIFLNLFISYLLVIFTLGIAFPWAVVRMTKLYLESVSLETEIDFSTITAQPDATASATVEGVEALAEALEGFIG